MDLGLSGRRAMVMAASRGLGRACAEALARDGCAVAMGSRDDARITAAAQQVATATGGRTLPVACDVTQPTAIAAATKTVRAQLGGCDVLVINSGGPKPGTFDALDAAAFAGAAELLLLNAVRTAKAFLPLIRASDQGRIIVLTSVSVREPIANLMLSNSLRAAVAGWAKTLARELGPEGITVNCVAPGTVQTERIDELVAANAERTQRPRDQVAAEMRARIPLGRFGRPEEFAAAVAFLASAPASYITGTTLYVDGGMLASVV